MQQNPESNDAYKFLWYENNVLALNKLDIKRFADELIDKMPGNPLIISLRLILMRFKTLNQICLVTMLMNFLKYFISSWLGKMHS
jgi:hypothetical protein